MMPRALKRRLVICVASLSLVAVFIPCTSSWSQSKAGLYPSDSVTVIVPFQPGGGVDTQARLMAPYIKKYLPNPVNVIVQNHPGAGGKVGFLKVFDARPDGYTIELVPSTVPGVLYIMGDLGRRDPHTLTYLARTGYTPYMLVRSSRGRFKNVDEMKGREVKFGGPRGMLFQAALIAKLLDLKMAYITYDGLPEAAMAAMRGDLDVFFPVWDTGIKHVKASEGKLIPMFVTAEVRVPESPDIPTAKEFGLEVKPEEVAVLASGNWLVAPPGLSDDVAGILRNAVFKAVSDPELEIQMQKANYTTKPILSPEQTTKNANLTYGAYSKYKDLFPRQ